MSEIHDKLKQLHDAEIEFSEITSLLMLDHEEYKQIAIISQIDSAIVALKNLVWLAVYTPEKPNDDE